MGWGNCGTDSKGRPIGYNFEATCDHPGCDAKIDRGLDYACGGMHGNGEYDCEGYFCHAHQHIVELPDEKRAISVCPECLSHLMLDDDNKIIGVIDDGQECPYEKAAPVPD